jgi:WD40 repeat protein
MTTNTPLQLYYSGLIFSPEQSVVRKTYSRDIPEWICPLPRVEATWSPHLQTLTGHSNWVQSVSFSPDGSTLASGSDDTTIKLWDVETGSELQTLTGHSNWVHSVAHSLPPGGHHIPVSHNNSNSARFDLDPQLTLSGNWVSVAGAKLIFIPPEYYQHNCSAANGTTISLGYSDGRVLIMGFHFMLH